MELKYYLDKTIDEYLGGMGTVTSKKIMNYLYCKYNIDANIRDIVSILKERESILEIVDGIYVDKNSFFSIVAPIETDSLKLHIEFQYLVSINEEQMTGILNMINSYRNQKINQKEEENERKWTYNKIMNFGMENGHISSSWVDVIDYNLEKEVQDYFQAIEAIEEKGIKIRYSE